MKHKLVSILMVVCVTTLAFSINFSTATPVSAFSYQQLTTLQKRLLSGFAALELNPANATTSAPLKVGSARVRAGGVTSANMGSGPTAYMPGNNECAQNFGGNVKVNQNCLNISDPNLQGRSQAQNETSIAIDPNNPNHIVAVFNDYRRGDGTCGVSYTQNGGQTWSDTTTPNGFTLGANFGGVAREYWQAGGDPSVAWDTQGNVYLNCQVFLRGLGTSNNTDASSAVYLFRSTQNNGASFNFTGRPIVEDYDTTGATLQDKPYMTVDNHVGSPFQDRIYTTWTNFAADGTGYIFESHSNDYGETFSAPVLVSGDSTLCSNTFGIPTPQGKCNENQYSDPFTGSDGALYVAYSNFNNSVSGLDNRNQILLVKSTDGGVTFGAPVKVADYYDLPDCATYQGGLDAGRACIPEKGSTTNSIFRATNYPAGQVNPTNAKQIAVSIGSYINQDSQEPNCVPNGFSAFGTNLYNGVKTVGGCKNAILLSGSTDGGATFTGTSTDPRSLLDITSRGDRQEKSDQYFQWLAFTPSGNLAVSYYDRQYKDDELTGFSDISLTTMQDSRGFSTQRVTNVSNPPPSEFSGVFMGDYAGLDATDRGRKSVAYPLWSDTRNNDLFLCAGTGVPGVPPQVCTAAASNAAVANDEDIFTAAVPFSSNH